MRLVNEHPNDRMALRARNFRMNEFDSVVDGSLLSNLTNAFYN